MYHKDVHSSPFARLLLVGADTNGIPFYFLESNSQGLAETVKPVSFN